MTGEIIIITCFYCYHLSKYSRVITFKILFIFPFTQSQVSHFAVYSLISTGRSMLPSKQFCKNKHLQGKHDVFTMGKRKLFWKEHLLWGFKMGF